MSHRQQRSPVDPRPQVHEEYLQLTDRIKGWGFDTVTRKKPYKILLTVRINSPATLNVEIASLISTVATDLLADLHFRIKHLEHIGKVVNVLLVPDWGYWFRTLAPDQAAVMVEMEDDVIPI